MTIAVDAMGGDLAPGPELEGVKAAAASGVKILLCGDEKALLEKWGSAPRNNVEIVHAPEAVTMEDHPGQVFRKKTRSSLRVALEQVKAGRAHGMVSAGNSGAVLSHALFVLGRLPWVERPGIVTVFPTPSGRLVLCDMGANVEVKPTMLAQFGVLGAHFDRIVFNNNTPRLGVLSNGSEESKGNDLTRAASELLRSIAETSGAGFTFCGYVEGTDLFTDKVDVVATDGFTGNIVLKTAEGVSMGVVKMVKKRLEASLRGKLGGALIRPIMRAFVDELSYAEAGGAPLLGVQGVVLIAHGKSDGRAMRNAILAADRYAMLGLTPALEKAMAEGAHLWQPESDVAEQSDSRELTPTRSARSGSSVA